MIDAVLLLVIAAGTYLLVSFTVGHLVLWGLLARDLRKQGRRLAKAGFDVNIIYRPTVITLRARHIVSGRVRESRQRVNVFS